MRQMILVLVIVTILTSTIGHSQSQENTGNIIVPITGFRNDKGVIKVALFNNKNGFPDKGNKAIKVLDGIIENKKSEVIFQNIPYGVYAIGIFHDEDKNGKMKTGLFGIPKEGYGASNNAKGFMGPPKYDDAKFELKSSTTNIEIKVCY